MCNVYINVALTNYENFKMVTKDNPTVIISHDIWNYLLLKFEYCNLFLDLHYHKHRDTVENEGKNGFLTQMLLFTFLCLSLLLNFITKITTIIIELSVYISIAYLSILLFEVLRQEIYFQDCNKTKMSTMLKFKSIVE